MGSKIYRERSIEFQLKVDTSQFPSKADAAAFDAALYAKVQKVIVKAVKKIAGKSELRLEFPRPWRREGIRYDSCAESAKGLFRQHNMTLAIEATDAQTKFKCKQHHFIPELLYDKPKAALCYPKDKGSDTKLKLEQDIHFDNCKFCASGSLYLDGRHTDIATVSDFSELFPGIESLAAPETALFPVSHWQETVCGKMLTAWDEISLEWNLVNRRDFHSGALLESELSYKIGKAMKDDWDYALLQLASRLYLDLGSAAIFLPYPPIFMYRDPVAGVEIAEICRKTAP